jgi:carnitine O-palmitoyltransferase 1
MARYLRSVRPLLDDKTYEKFRKEAQEFENGIGKKLQRYLILKSWWSSNYVSDWWEEYVYLRSPNPLIVNSNIYGTDYFKHVTKNQAARAANMTHLYCEYNERVKRHDLKPVMSQGLVPLCMWQFERLYNTTRVPGINGDKLVTAKSSNHIVVMHKGSYYKMLTKFRGRMLKPIEMQYQFEQILNADVTASHGEEFVAALTAWDRPKWAQVRDKYFTSGPNRLSINEIDTAAFMVVLEDEPYEFSIKSNPNELGAYARNLLHGKGNNIWLDKSFSLLVSKDGRVSLII